MGDINNCSFKNALWIGRCKLGDAPMRIYVHGEYKNRAGDERLLVNKGDTPSRYHFGVKREHIVWIEDQS